MPLLLSESNCQYTPIVGGTNTSTTTLNPGQSGVPGPGQQGQQPSSFGVFYGASVLSLGTSTTTGTGTGGVAQVVNAYDVVPPTGLGTNTATLTNLLMNGTATAPAVIQAGVPGIGLRYKGALVLTVAGGATPGTTNALWD